MSVVRYRWSAVTWRRPSAVEVNWR